MDHKVILGELQMAVLTRIRNQSHHESRTSVALSRHLKVPMISVVSACRALEKKGLIGRSYVGSGRWATLNWYITNTGKDILK